MTHVCSELDHDGEAFCERLFDGVDADGSGYISREELKTVLSNIGLPSTEREVDSIFDRYDVDASDELDKHEFQVRRAH